MTKTTLTPLIIEDRAANWRSCGETKELFESGSFWWVLRNSNLSVAVCQPKPTDYVTDLQYNGLFVSTTSSTPQMFLLPYSDKTVGDQSQGAALQG